MSSRRRASSEQRERARAAAERVWLSDSLDTLVGSLSHGQQRQLEVGMASATDPKLMMLDEPASGLSRGERERLTELLLSLPADVTLILIEHDMDIALRVAAVRDDDARRPEGRRGHAGRDPRATRWCTTSTSAAGSRMSDTPLLELEDVHAFYGSAHILEGVSLSMGVEAIAVIGRNGMGKSTLCNTIMGLCRETQGSIKVARQGGARPPAVRRRRRGRRLRARRAAACSRRSRSTSTCA